MHPAAVAELTPDRPAVIMGTSGEVTTFRELDERSNRLAQLFRACGLRPGDRMAVFLENHPRFLEITWAAQRAGLGWTAVNSHLTVEEAAYIVDDCGAGLLVSSHRLSPVAGQLTPDRVPNVRSRLMIDGVVDGWEPFDDAVAEYPTDPVADECEGDMVLYSSGTTGRPKGIQRALTLAPMGEGPPLAVPLLQLIGFDDGGVFLSPAPLYHSAPVAWSMSAHRLGGTVVVMEGFDAGDALRLIEQHEVTHSQWVPTMFVRMLKLPAETRSSYDLSSHRGAAHAAAPCPVPVKQQMIEWWGPIIYEYYSSTEGVGATFIDSKDWLAHPGSVGKPMIGEPHILDEDGNELPSGEPGTVWFKGGVEFEYRNDPDKTAAAKDEYGYGYRTVGDVGYLDDEGYLYLTDRKAHMIIRGGANVYPQETENVLVMHPKVLDAAVIGVPDEDLGEEVKAVVQPADWDAAGPELEQELLAFCHEHLASYKCPRSVAFERQLPRLDTGKLYKQALREKYAKPA